MSNIKINWNRKYLTISIYAIFVLVSSALLIIGTLRLPKLVAAMEFTGAVIMPLFAGIAIAYLLNPLMMFIENNIFANWQKKADTRKKKRLIRGVSLFITIIITITVFTAFILVVVPQLVQNISSVFDKLPVYFEDIRKFVIKNFSDEPFLQQFLVDPLKKLELSYGEAWNILNPMLSGFMNNIASGVWKVIEALKNVIIGFVISIYLLFSKEMFIGQVKKTMFAFFKNSTCQKSFNIYHKCNKIFLGSVIARIIDSFIVGVICFIGCVILGFPYALLISVIMFVFNLIPFFGGMIGAIPCTLLLLLSDKPIQALWFVIFITILLNVDGNVINPRITGGQTGLPTIWVMLSIIIGAGFFGFTGMILSVPVFAVLYMLVKVSIENRLEKKKLPQSTLKYQGNVEHMVEDYEYTQAEKIADMEKLNGENGAETSKRKFKGIFGFGKNDDDKKE